MDEEIRAAIDAVKEQQPVTVGLDWYQDTIKLPEIKEFIRANINAASRSFVAIGYYLKYVRDKQLYKDDGYSGISDFAKAEFGISAAQASKFMSINDRFSKDGNSPVLLEQYRDFSSSKLSEMLYLTDEQLEQVTITTTKAEIREIGKPVKEEISFSPAKTEPKSEKQSYIKCASYDFFKFGKGCTGCYYDKAENNCPYDRTEYFAEIKRQEDWNIRCGVLKEMCDCICKMSSYVLEKNNYSNDAIKTLSRRDQDFSFGFSDNGAGHSKYDAEYKAKNNRYYVEEFNGSGKWTFEAGEVDQQIWNVNGNTWRFKQYETEKSNTVNDIPETAKTEPEYIELIVNEEEDDTEEVPCRSCKYDTMNPDEYLKDHPGEKLPCIVCDDEFSSWRSKDFEEKVEQEDNHIHRPDLRGLMQDPYCKVCGASLRYKQDCKCGNQIDWSGLELVFEFEEEQLKQQAEQEQFEADPEEVEVLEAEIIETESKEPQHPVQPDLPILKNNDQRKDFIEAYETWPIWIDIKETGERYYRYNLTDKAAMVVKVSWKHSYQGYKETKDYEYSAEQYYLLGIKSEWHQTGVVFTEDESRTFYECSSNKSALVDYLKYFQKKGA